MTFVEVLRIELIVFLIGYVGFQFARAVLEARRENTVGSVQHDCKTVREHRKLMRLLQSSRSAGSAAQHTYQQAATEGE